jgi:hypothetical protein
MIWESMLAAAVLVAAVNLTGTVFAGANDYVFEPVKAEVKKGDDVVVSVRLKHKATGKPVIDAVIIQTRIDMSPDAMSEMACHPCAQQRAWRLFVQNRSLDARPVAAKHCGQSAGRAGDGHRQDHLPRDPVTPCLDLRAQSCLHSV